jgi:hypothetical protein
MLTTFTEQQSTGNSQLIVWGIDCVNGMDQIFWFIISHERAVVRSSNELLADLPRAVGCTEGEGHNFAYSQKGIPGLLQWNLHQKVPYKI